MFFTLVSLGWLVQFSNQVPGPVTAGSAALGALNAAAAARTMVQLTFPHAAEKKRKKIPPDLHPAEIHSLE
jgi:hypothetical protein